MAEQIDTSTRAQLNEVEVRNTSVKQTPNTSFGQVLRNGISGTGNAIGSQLGSAGYIIPGSSVVGAAISGIGNVRDSSSPVASGVGGGSSTLGAGIGGIGGVSRDATSNLTGGLGGNGLGTGTGTGAGLTSGTNSSGALLAATQQLTESNNQFNLQYLGLQENMQQENREFTAVSNVIKAKNDTAKNSLSNLK